MSHAKLPNRFRVGHPRRFRLRDVDPAETAGFSKENADRMLAKHTGRLADLQEWLHAEDSWALLGILRGVWSCRRRS